MKKQANELNQKLKKGKRKFVYFFMVYDDFVSNRKM